MALVAAAEADAVAELTAAVNEAPSITMAKFERFGAAVVEVCATVQTYVLLL